MRRSRAMWLSLGAALAAFALLGASAWRGAAALPFLALTFAVTPGACVAGTLAPSRGRATRMLLALTLSPFMVGAPAAALLALGVPGLTVARTIVVAIAVLALASAGRRRPPAIASEGGTPWVAALAWAGAVGLLLFANRYLVMRSDGWFHAAVTLEVHGRGLPLEDPFFAGLKLLYFWGVHVWASLWLELVPATSVWTPFLVLDVSAALATILGVTLICRRLGGSVRAQALAAALAVGGYSPFGWVLLALHATLGHVTGTTELRHLLTHGLLPVLVAMDPGVLHPSLVFFGDKFLIATTFGLGLAVFAAFVLTLLDAAERPAWRTWMLLALLQATALFMHSVIGWANAIAAGGWWWWALWRSRSDDEAPLRRTLLPLITVFALAAVVLWPYLEATTAGKHQSFHFGLDGPTLRTWLLAGGLLVPAGMAWLVSRARVPGPARDVLGLAVPLTLAALLLGMPLGNQSKLFNLLFLLLAAPAAMGWMAWSERARGARRAVLIAALVLAIVPNLALCTWGFATEHGQLALGWDRPDSPSERDAWLWASANLARDAVMVDASERLDFTVHAARSALWGGADWAKNWGYDPAALDVRRRAAETLGRGEPPPPDVRALLAVLARPVFVVARRADAADPRSPWATLAAAPPQAARTRGFEPVFRNGDVALFRWRESP